MKLNKILNKESYFVIFLFIFSLGVNQYYGNKGVFPVDSFAHFDNGFRILLGEYPFKNFWTVSGPIVDYIQSIFFYFLGVNWQTYVFHASLFNAILSIATFRLFINLDLNVNFSFIYSLFFCILAYPTSGTPFVDLHSAFFSLLGIYSLILAIKKEKKIYWILLPILFTFAFLSKQVPSSYIIISIILVLIIFTITQKKYYWIKYSFLSLSIFIIFLVTVCKIQGISLSSFFNQYIFYPLTIGDSRLDNLNITFRGVLDHFKFIYISLLIPFIVNLKKVFFENNYYKSKSFCYFLIFTLFTFSLILHQLLTRNQTFIFFLIPILFAFSHTNLNLKKLNLKRSIPLLLVLFCFFITIKYHLRFNENRKFHELSYVDFKKSTNAQKIDKKLLGLKWITPNYKDQPKKEIALINQSKQHLLNDNRTKMLMTHYSFFSVILNQKLFATTRYFLTDGSSHPFKEHEYYMNYKNLLIKVIKNNHIKVIYTIHPVKSSLIYAYLDKNCFKEIKISEVLNSYEIQNCNEINS